MFPGSVVEAVSHNWVEKVLFHPLAPPTHRSRVLMTVRVRLLLRLLLLVMRTFFQCTRAANEWNGHVSGIARAHHETVSPGQFGERCWQECHMRILTSG